MREREGSGGGNGAAAGLSPQGQLNDQPPELGAGAAACGTGGTGYLYVLR